MLKDTHSKQSNISLPKHAIACNKSFQIYIANSCLLFESNLPLPLIFKAHTFCFHEYAITNHHAYITLNFKTNLNHEISPIWTACLLTPSQTVTDKLLLQLLAEGVCSFISLIFRVNSMGTQIHVYIYTQYNISHWKVRVRKLTAAISS